MIGYVVIKKEKGKKKREREREKRGGGGGRRKRTMPDFGDSMFWDAFYGKRLKDATEFEWHHEPKVLKGHVMPGLTNESVVCDFGCGLSTMGDMLYDSGTYMHELKLKWTEIDHQF